VALAALALQTETRGRRLDDRVVGSDPAAAEATEQPLLSADADAVV
jgi:hypothetical protein